MAVKQYDRRGREDDRERGIDRAVQGRPVAWALLQIGRGVKWLVHRTLYGALGTMPGRVVTVGVAVWVLAHTTFGAAVPGAGYIPHALGVALAGGVVAYGKRRRWEESIRDTIREAVPGHTMSRPEEVTFGPRLKAPNLYRWTGRYDFRFRVPNVVRRSHIFDIEDHLAEQLRASQEATWFLSWDLKMGQAFARAIPEVPRLISQDNLAHAIATYPGGDRVGPGVIPIGVSTKGIEVWEPEEVPHVLVCGTTGGGKSVAERTILKHLLEHPDSWLIYAIDPKRVELAELRGYPNVRSVATDTEDMLAVVQGAYEEMEARYERMEASGTGAKKIHELDPDAPRIMLVIDELADITGQSGLKTPEAKAEDQMAGQMGFALDRIAAKGRAAGVHLLLCTQRPDVADGVMSGKMRHNVGGRLACGRMDPTSSRMVLRDSDAASQLEDEKGRGIWMPDGDVRKLQIVLTEPEDLPAKPAKAATKG